MIYNELKRSIFSYKMLFVVCVFLIIIIRVLVRNDSFLYETDIINLYYTCFGGSGLVYFVSFLVAIPYSSIFCDEFNSGYINFIIAKVGYNRYIKKRIIFVSISGAFTVLVSMIIIFIIIFIVGTPATSIDMSMIKNSIWYNANSTQGIIYFVIGKLILGATYGAVWATISLAVSTWLPNKYITLVTPFVINSVLWVVLSKYPYINPLLMFRGDFTNTGSFIGSFNYIIVFQLALFYLAVLIFCKGARKRLIHD